MLSELADCPVDAYTVAPVGSTALYVISLETLTLFKSLKYRLFVNVFNDYTGGSLIARVGARDGQTYRYALDENSLYVISCVNNHAMQGLIAFIYNKKIIYRSHDGAFDSSRCYFSGTTLILVNDATNSGFQLMKVI